MKIAYDAFEKQSQNFYTTAMAELLQDLGWKVVGVSFKTLILLDTTVVMLNWFIPSSGGLFQQGLWPLVKLFMMKLFGKRLVFVHHNNIPHDSRHPIVATFVQWVCYRFANVLVVHNMVDFNSISLKHGRKVHFVPHPNYVGVYGPPCIGSKAKDHLVLGFLGAIRPYKNLEVLIRAFQQTNASNLRLHIRGGSNNPAYVERLKVLIGEDERVNLNIGYVPDEEIPIFLSEIDIMVLPYDLLSVSNSGSAILAASYSVPIVIPEIHGVVGWPIDKSFCYFYSTKDEHVEVLGRCINSISHSTRSKLNEDGAKLYRYVLQKNARDVVEDALDTSIRDLVRVGRRT